MPGPVIGEAAITIGADASKFNSTAAKQIEGAADKGGSSFNRRLATTLKAGAVVAGGAVATVIGVSLAKGFTRLKSIDDARWKLIGLGHSAEEVKTIMDTALKTVLGTSYGFGEAASLAATVVASGIKPGKELARTLTIVEDTATIAGTSLKDMGAIFNKAAANGKLNLEVVGQLQDRGVPVLKMIADQYGVTMSKAREMVSAGVVDFNTFQTAMEKGLGGAAKRSGRSFSGALANVGAALSRFGAAVLGGVFSQLPGLFANMIKWIDKVTPSAQRFGELVGKAFTAVYKTLQRVFGSAAFREGLASFFRQARDAITDLLPSVQRFGSMLGQNVLPAIKTLAAVLLSLGRVLLKQVVPAIKWLLDFLVRYQSVIVPIVGAIVAMVLAFKTYVGIVKVITAITKAWTAVQIALSMALLANPIGIIITAVVGLIAVIALLWVKNEGFRNFVIGAWNAILGVVKSVVTWFSENVLPVLNGIWEGIKIGLKVLGFAIALYLAVWFSIFKTTFKLIKAVITTVWNFIKPFIKAAMAVISSVIRTQVAFWLAVFRTIAKVVGWVAGWFHDIWDKITGWIGKIGTAVGKIVDKILGPFKGIFETMKGIGGDIVEGIWEGIKGLGSWLWDKVTGFIKDNLPGPIAKALGLGSPSKVMAEQGRWAALGLAKGILSGQKAVQQASTTLARSVMPSGLSSSLSAASRPVTALPTITSGAGAPTSATTTVHVALTVSVDDLAKLHKIDDFLAMIEGARVRQRQTARSGTVAD